MKTSSVTFSHTNAKNNEVELKTLLEAIVKRDSISGKKLFASIHREWVLHERNQRERLKKFIADAQPDLIIAYMPAF